MKPYYEADGITLYCGDNRDVLPSLPRGGLVITDPPFGVREDQAWDRMTEQEFNLFNMEWLAGARRLSPSLAVFCSGYGNFPRLCELLWPRVRRMVWDKPAGSQYAGSAEAGMWFAHEVILHCYETWACTESKSLEVAGMIRMAREKASLSRGAVDKAVRGKRTGLCYRWEEASCLPTADQSRQLKELLGLDGAFDEALERAYAAKNNVIAEGRDVFSYRTETDTLHPCQKPLGLMRELVARLTEPNQTVIDPFAGSGTTLRAAKDQGRKAIGVELEERYCELAARRLEQGVFAWPD